MNEFRLNGLGFHTFRYLKVTVRLLGTCSDLDSQKYSVKTSFQQGVGCHEIMLAFNMNREFAVTFNLQRSPRLICMDAVIAASINNSAIL